MTILRRLNDILSANLNDLVDRFEDPPKMLKHAIREMQTAVDGATAAAARSIAAEKLLTDELADQQRCADRYRRRAEQALSAGNEPQAREALRRKQSFDRQVEEISAQQAKAAETNERLRRHIERLQSRLAEARRLLAVYSARHQVAVVRRQFNQPPAASGFVRLESLARFEGLRARVASVEAEADAWAELTGTADATEEGEFDETERDAAIEQELIALRENIPTDETT